MKVISLWFYSLKTIYFWRCKKSANINNSEILVIEAAMDAEWVRFLNFSSVAQRIPAGELNTCNTVMGKRNAMARIIEDKRIDFQCFQCTLEEIIMNLLRIPMQYMIRYISLKISDQLLRLSASSTGHICNEGIFARLIATKYMQSILVHMIEFHL